MPKRQIIASVILICITAMPVHGIWFEASGQAVIENGNRQIARQQATEEAIKQALLFAGASVKSVQHMTNGLLKEDRFEIRAGGEVNKIELIDERYENNVVTVAIRADIFPQDKTCAASDYNKSLVTSWFPIVHRQQAAIGHVYDMGKAVADKLENEFLEFAQHSKIKNIQPYYVDNLGDSVEEVMALSRKANSQYVLLGEISDLSVDEPKSAGLAFWQKNSSTRHFGLEVILYDGQTGAMLMQKNIATSAPWDFDLHSSVMPQSQKMWRSKYGQSISSVLQDLVQDIDEKVSCLPAYGRIIDVQNERLQINLGAHEGVEAGDQLTLYQLNQFYDSAGLLHTSYKLHPTKVMIKQVMPNSAVAEALNGQYLANIQPNDFVARH